jgi:hypothetical protein
MRGGVVESPKPRLGERVRRRLVDSPQSLGASSRHRRWQRIGQAFPELSSMSVVDLGGTVESWLRAPIRPARVVVVNLFEPGDSQDPTLVPVAGDACDARAALKAAGQGSTFDLAFSNSLIEHVGGHAKRSALAEEVRDLAPRHWVQTPYRYFPLEPHWLFPMMQFLPIRARADVAASWPLTHTRPATWADARDEVQWTELLSITEMRAYFPGSEIYMERVAGLVKSITAIRTSATS